MCPVHESGKSTFLIFTDRALYRPGQVVHVSGVAYEQSGDSVRVFSRVHNDVVLRDANRQEVGKISLATDEFGAFHGDFVLPEVLLPGRIRNIGARWRKAAISV